MGVFDFITDAFTLSVAHAEAPADEPEAESGDAGEEEEKSADGEGEDAEAAEEEPEEEEEEEEEEEPEDLKPKFEEECANSGTCAPAKHHYDDCVERVTKQIEENDGKAKENCVEEFFHLAHCASACAAPKLFSSLK